MLTFHWWGLIIWPHPEARGDGKCSVWQGDISQAQLFVLERAAWIIGGQPSCHIQSLKPPQVAPVHLSSLLSDCFPWLCSTHTGPLLISSSSLPCDFCVLFLLSGKFYLPHLFILDSSLKFSSLSSNTIITSGVPACLPNMVHHVTKFQLSSQHRSMIRNYLCLFP